MQFSNRLFSWTGQGLRLGLPVFMMTLGSASRAADLAHIYDLSVQNDPQLGAASASFKAQAEISSRARSGLLPSISLGVQTNSNRRKAEGVNFLTGMPGTEVTNFNDHGWNVSLRQPVFRLDRWFQFHQAKKLKRQASLNFAIAQQELMVRVAESYLRILETQDGLAAANASHDAVRRQLDQVQQRFDVGLVAITDLLEAQAAFDTAEVALIEARGAQNVSFEALRRLTGQNFSEISGLEADFPVALPDPPDADAWVETALIQNLAIRAAHQGLLAAKSGVRAARSAYLPTVDASISRTDNTTGGGGFFGSELEQDVYGLTLSVPIYTGGRTRSLAREANFRREQAKSNLELQQRAAVEAVRSRFSALETDVARVKSTLQGIESSKSALDATQTGYEVGTRNIVDVFNAQQRLYTAQFQYHSARYRYILDLLRLKQLAGSLSPDDIYALDGYMETGAVVKRIGRRLP